MINSAEEGVQFLLGETMAITLLVNALIKTHSNPEALAQVVEQYKAEADRALREKPPTNLQLFRYEQLLDDMVSHIRDTGQD